MTFLQTPEGLALHDKPSASSSDGILAALLPLRTPAVSQVGAWFSNLFILTFPSLLSFLSEWLSDISDTDDVRISGPWEGRE